MWTLSNAEINEFREWFAEIDDLLKHLMKLAEWYIQASENSSNERRFQWGKSLHQRTQEFSNLIPQYSAAINVQIEPIDLHEILSETRTLIVAIHGYVKLLSHTLVGESNEIEAGLLAKSENYAKTLYTLAQQAEPFIKVFERHRNSFPTSS